LGRWFEGADRRKLRLRTGQAIKITKRTGGQRVAYWIRCLPSDFPGFEFKRRAEPLYDHYIFDPGGVDVAPYAIIVDRWGVPVWWRSVSSAIDAKVIDGLVVWATDFQGLAFNVGPDAAYEFRRLNGKLVRRLQAVGTTTDFHDLQPTADGNYALLSYRPRFGVDVSAYTGDADATVFDGVVQKLSPDGQLLWEWSTADHISLAETGRWWAELEEPYDLVHINAVEPLADGDVLISLRHTDAVYRIDGATGEVKWKLGGTPTAASLSVVGDPHAGNPLGAQHDVRYLGDDTISVHDNATDLGRAPRAVRYRIRGSTATLIDSQSDPLVPESRCCGSARYSRGHWLLSWGGEPLITEFASDGSRTFKLIVDSAFSYRVVGVPDLSTQALRAGMNAQVKPKR
jgi:hypothetical protein